MLEMETVNWLIHLLISNSLYYKSSFIIIPKRQVT